MVIHVTNISSAFRLPFVLLTEIFEVQKFSIFINLISFMISDFGIISRKPSLPQGYIGTDMFYSRTFKDLLKHKYLIRWDLCWFAA